MDHRQHIAAILKQWLALAQAEGQDIQRGDWAALGRTQEAKAALRPPLTQAIEAWRADNPIEAGGSPFQEQVGQLLALETHNGSLWRPANARRGNRGNCWSRPCSICAASVPCTCRRRKWS